MKRLLWMLVLVNQVDESHSAVASAASAATITPTTLPTIILPTQQLEDGLFPGFNFS
jgi:hypothetical protein